MVAVTPSAKQFARFALVAMIGLAAVATAKAGGIQYTSQQKSACMSDALRLCSSEIPNVSRIQACMESKKSSLTPGCRAMFRS